MKKSEIISANIDKLAAAMVERYRNVLESNGRMQYTIYIWEDGELECLQAVQGDHSWLQPRDAEPRALYYVTTVSEAPGFDLFVASGLSEPEDDAEREAAEAEIVDWLVDSYKENLPVTLDAIMEDAEREDD